MFNDAHINEFSNAFTLVGDQWMLITVKDGKKLNPMTASWGGLGILWGLPVTYNVIRPQRHTFKLMQGADHYTLSFFGAEHRKTLQYCGSHSGRDCDKAADTGLTPVMCGDWGYFQEAQWVLCVKKLYVQTFNPDCAAEPALFDTHYPNQDFHRLFIGHVEKILYREE